MQASGSKRQYLYTLLIGQLAGCTLQFEYDPGRATSVQPTELPPFDSSASGAASSSATSTAGISSALSTGGFGSNLGAGGTPSFSAGGGSTPAVGGFGNFPGMGGAGGASAPCASGGSPAMPGSGGSAGNGTTADCPESFDPGVTGALFEYLGDGLRCENADRYGQGTNLEKVEAAISLADCQAECLQRPDCSAVSQFANVQPLALCVTRTVPCGTPSTGPWQEEDAGKEYLKVCPPGEACRFDYLGDWIRCEEGASAASVTTSFQDCQTACLADPNCTAITDYFWIGEVSGCYLNTSTCTAPSSLPWEDDGKVYRKLCTTVPVAEDTPAAGDAGGAIEQGADAGAP